MEWLDSWRVTWINSMSYAEFDKLYMDLGPKVIFETSDGKYYLLLYKSYDFTHVMYCRNAQNNKRTSIELSTIVRVVSVP